MKEWNEMEFAMLQFRIEHMETFGRKITLDDGAFTLMAAYLLGLSDGAYSMDEEEVDKLTRDIVYNY